MARWFNIAGPCNAADNYLLSAMERLPEVAALVRKRQYFVVRAPRQCGKTTPFAASVALIGMRDIRDYKAKIRPDTETLGSASPFNVITKALTVRSFNAEEVRALYRQHTDETGQVFEDEAIEKAFAYSQGQPYLVNALARWCVEEIHHEDFSHSVTGADMDEAAGGLTSAFTSAERCTPSR